MTTDIIRNRVAESGVETINLLQFRPPASSIRVLGISNFTGGELIIREKVFRQALKEYDFSDLNKKIVCLIADMDCVVQPWVWMLLAAYLKEVAEWVTVGNWNAQNEAAYIFNRFTQAYPPEKLRGMRLIFNGCGSLECGPLLYTQLTFYVAPYVQSVMFGEPCSAVPVLKNSRL